MDTKAGAPHVLPIPPTVNQNTALLPDGKVDPPHATDCGEACLCSVLRILRKALLSPGCIRQMRGISALNGSTTPEELRSVLGMFGLPARLRRASGARLWDTLGQLRHHGQYAILLGHWQGPDELHWVVAYERSESELWVMDPWRGDYRTLGRADVARLSSDVQVRV